MNKKNIFISFVLLGLILLPGMALAETRFNMMVNDQQGLQLKNETQGTATWVDPISANAGDYIRFNVYYHCGTTGSNIPAEKAQNTIVRLNFPTSDQTAINANAQISSSSASGATDSGTINVSSSQRLVFDGTAKWYRDNNQTVTDIAIIQGSGYVEVNLGEIACDVVNCYSNAGYVIFRGHLTSNTAPTLYATLEALPNNGIAPLNGVDLRATATGTASGAINYRFDCTSDGVWDHSFYGIYDNPKTVIDACNYQNAGSYIAKVSIERGTASPAIATAVVNVGQIIIGEDISVVKYARNLSKNTLYATVMPASPSDLIEFRILVSPNGNTTLTNLAIRDTLPSNMIYSGNLKVDGSPIVGAGDILTNLNLGTMSPQQTKTISFEAVIASADKFGFGQTDLVNTVLVYNTALAKTAAATIRVNKTEVKGITDVPTGIFDNAKLAFIFSFGITLFLTYFLLLRFYLGNRVYVWGVNDVFQSAKNKVKNVLPKTSGNRSEDRLAKMIEKIKNKEQ